MISGGRLAELLAAQPGDVVDLATTSLAAFWTLAGNVAPRRGLGELRSAAAAALVARCALASRVLFAPGSTVAATRDRRPALGLGRVRRRRGTRRRRRVVALVLQGLREQGDLLAQDGQLGGAAYAARGADRVRDPQPAEDQAGQARHDEDRDEPRGHRPVAEREPRRPAGAAWLSLCRPAACPCARPARRACPAPSRHRPRPVRRPCRACSCPPGLWSFPRPRDRPRARAGQRRPPASPHDVERVRAIHRSALACVHVSAADKYRHEPVAAAR